MASIDEAYERWAYEEGWSAGLLDGRRQGFEEGYRAGFDAGAETGAARVLLGLERALGGSLPDLLPDLPHVAAFADYRRRTAPSDELCAEGCGSCSRCVRAAAVAANVARYGSPDHPGRVRNAQQLYSRGVADGPTAPIPSIGRGEVSRDA
jgi:hypothetical protein